MEVTVSSWFVAMAKGSVLLSPLPRLMILTWRDRQNCKWTASNWMSRQTDRQMDINLSILTCYHSLSAFIRQTEWLTTLFCSQVYPVREWFSQSRTPLPVESGAISFEVSRAGRVMWLSCDSSEQTGLVGHSLHGGRGSAYVTWLLESTWGLWQRAVYWILWTSSQPLWSQQLSASPGAR